MGITQAIDDADDKDVLFVQDDDKKTEVKESKKPAAAPVDELSHVNGDDAQDYTNSMASKTNESHGFEGKEVDTSKMSDLELSKNSKD